MSALKILIAEIIIFEPNAYFYPQQMIQGWDEDNIKYKTYFSPWNRMHILYYNSEQMAWSLIKSPSSLLLIAIECYKKQSKRDQSNLIEV